MQTGLCNSAGKKAAKLGREIRKPRRRKPPQHAESAEEAALYAEFLAPLYRKTKVKPFVKQLKSLQDVFGYVNDVAMAAQLRELCGSDKPAALTGGEVLGYHEAKARECWQEAPAAWHRLRRLLLEVARTFSRCALRIAAAKSSKRHREAATGRRGDPEISNVLVGLLRGFAPRNDDRACYLMLSATGCSSTSAMATAALTPVLPCTLTGCSEIERFDPPTSTFAPPPAANDASAATPT